MHEYNYFAAFYMFEINSTNTTKLKHQPCTLDVTAKKLAVNTFPLDASFHITIKRRN